MNLKSEDRGALIRHRINQSDETKEEMLIMWEHGKYRAVINRIYYCLFYRILALALYHRIQTSKHQQLIAWFNKQFISNDILERKHGRFANNIHRKRGQGDYEAFVEFEPEEIKSYIAQLDEANAAIDELLSEALKSE